MHYKIKSNNRLAYLSALLCIFSFLQSCKSLFETITPDNRSSHELHILSPSSVEPGEVFSISWPNTQATSFTLSIGRAVHCESPIVNISKLSDNSHEVELFEVGTYYICLSGYNGNTLVEAKNNGRKIIVAKSDAEIASEAAPIVTISSNEGAVTSAASFLVRVKFDQVVSGFSADDLAISNATISSFTALNASEYTFNLLPASDGIITVNIAAGAATNSKGKPSLAAAQFSRIYDSQGPTLVISSSSAPYTQASPIPVVLTFSDDVTGFDMGDLSISNGTAANFSGSGTLYSFELIPSAFGQVKVNVSAGAALDSLNNGSFAAVEFSRFYVNDVVVILSSTASATTDLSPFSVTATFSSDVTGLTIGDFVVGNGSASNFSGSGAIYTLDITPTTQGLVTVDLPAAAAQDALLIDNLAAAQLSRTYKISRARFDESTASEQIGVGGSYLIDINLDGKNDLVMVDAANAGLRKIQVYFGTANRDDLFPTQTLPVLNGTNGFTIIAPNFSQSSMFFQDANGDGKSDLLITVGQTNCVSGNGGYTLFSATGPWPASISLATDLNGTNGHKYTVSNCANISYGDLDGDGYIDIIQGGHSNSASSSTFIKWGSDSGFPASFSVESGGVTEILDDVAGGPYQRIALGDMTGDNISEIAISSSIGGSSYIFWGGTLNWGVSGSRPASINLSAIDGTNGTQIIGGGIKGSRIADINGDGLKDLINGGSYNASTGGATGGIFIFFGRSSASPWLASYSGYSVANGLTIIEGNWTLSERGLGNSIYQPADINGDGFVDLIAYSNDPYGTHKLHVIFGRATWPGLIKSGDFDGSTATGFRIALTTMTGLTYGDYNDDGYIDLALADKNNANGGKIWVLFGKASGYTGTMSLSGLDGTNGFTLTGSLDNAQLLGNSVSTGDFDADASSDLIVSSPNSAHAAAGGGSIYIFFGGASVWPADLEL